MTASKIRILAAVLLMAVLTSVTGCTSRNPAEPDTPVTVLTIGTADSGGTMYPVGSAIARVLEQGNLKINVSASTGSAMNARNLVSGEVDMALVSGDTALAAFEDPHGDGASLRTIAAVFLSQSNWMAAEDSGLEYVHDLERLRLGVGPERSSTEMSALAALKAAGLEEGSSRLMNCSLGTGTDLMLKHELDAVHGFSGAPIGALQYLAEKMPCRILKYTEEELESLLETNRIFVPVTLTEGTYAGQNEPIQSFGVKCLLCVDASMDDELAYELTEMLWQARDVLAVEHPAMAAMTEPGFVNEQLPVPLHSGAQRFYSEAVS